MEKAIKVLVVEDHHIVREGLVALLKTQKDLEIVGEAADGVSAIAKYRKHKPDITLIDLRLPRLSGVEVIRSIRKDFAGANFIVLTNYDGDEDVYRALEAGARAYLLKGMTARELLAVIRTVYAGGSHIPSAVAEKLAQRMSSKELSPREVDVLEQIVYGRSNKEAAARLKIAESTVKTHINKLLAKLGVADRTQATTIAIQRGIVPIDSLPVKRLNE